MTKFFDNDITLHCVLLYDRKIIINLMEATMLKKLVKYGNSNALILDRAILELLNINEGAVLKLHTD